MIEALTMCHVSVNKFF